jgi:hypothetical protein
MIGVSRLFASLVEYLSDWKNLLAHALIGVGILVVALWLPVSTTLRALILVVVIVGNIFRMRYEDRHTEQEEQR